jgi:hypothetical protein
LTLNGLHGVISQKMILFITTAVKTYMRRYGVTSQTMELFKVDIVIFFGDVCIFGILVFVIIIIIIIIIYHLCGLVVRVSLLPLSPQVLGAWSQGHLYLLLENAHV